MATIEFTANLTRHVDCPKESIAADSLSELLNRYFECWPDVRSYVLDDQGAVRHHVKVLVDGRNIRDRQTQGDLLHPASTVHIFQALSGG